MKYFLEFLSTLIWQGIIVACLWTLRAEIRALFNRITSFEGGGTRVLFQEHVQAELEPSPLVAKALEVRDEEGFFTKSGIEQLVQESRYFKGSVRDSVLVFSTPQQNTWLVATSSHVYFVLDDEGTRASQRLIQKLVPIADALPVETQQEAGDAGSFQLGKTGWWYYSKGLLGTPKKAAVRLAAFVRTAQTPPAT